MQEEAIRHIKACAKVANLWLFVQDYVFFQMLSIKQGSNMYHLKKFLYDLARVLTAHLPDSEWTRSPLHQGGCWSCQTELEWVFCGFVRSDI